jgi:hypothetical protein
VGLVDAAVDDADLDAATGVGGATDLGGVPGLDRMDVMVDSPSASD